MKLELMNLELSILIVWTWNTVLEHLIYKWKKYKPLQCKKKLDKTEQLNWIFYLKDTLFYLNYIFTKNKMQYDYCVYYYATVNNNKTQKQKFYLKYILCY